MPFGWGAAGWLFPYFNPYWYWRPFWWYGYPGYGYPGYGYPGYGYPMSKEQEKAMLQEEARILEDQLAQIRKRLTELEK